jgi:putative membrane protein
MKLLTSLFVAGLSLWLTSLILGDSMQFTGFWSIALTAVVIGLMNFVLRPLLNLLTCPIYLITLGLSRFLVSGLLLLLASSMVRGFQISGFWVAVMAAVLIAVLNSILESMLGTRKKD